jgi:Flp pilus assembly protein TadD
MRGSRFQSVLLMASVMACLLPYAYAGDLKIKLPKRSQATPVQQLNREGVQQLKRHHPEKAKRLFLKAYLLDPDDPFTLNNLGYISELEGDADRALRYYELSSKNNSQAVIDLASRPELKGRPLQEAFASLQVPELQSNKANVQAISLLGQGRIAEAEAVLKQALAGDPHNPFTLNNMGYVMEQEGDLQSALRYYSSAASLHSGDTVLVAPNPKWRGRAISEVADDNARAVNKEIAKGEDLNAQVARLNLRGVAAINHNDPQAALQFFKQAYKLDPRNAFSINNMGYVTELEGDRETAESYYQEARSAADANQKVTYATRRNAEGLRMKDVAQDNQVDVDARMEAIQAVRQRGGAPMPQLKRRDNTPVVEPEVKPAPPLQNVTPPALPAPELPNRTEQPPAEQQAPSQQPGIIEPLPESQQPPAAKTPQQPGDAIPPLPESQQPPNATTPSQPPTQQPPPPSQQTQPQSQPEVIPPLPESQQPPAARTPSQQPPPQPQQR